MLGLSLLLLLPAARASGQLFYRDPLTPREAAQLRNAADNPGKKVMLLLRDAARRLGNFERLRHGHSTGRRPQMYRMLREYRLILRELDDNLDNMVSGPRNSFMGKVKPQKPLRRVIAAEQHFAAELRRIRADSSPSDLASYHFELQNCMDSTHDSMANAQDDLKTVQSKKKKKKAQHG